MLSVGYKTDVLHFA